RDFIRLADAARGQHDRFGVKNLEAPAFAIITKRADDTLAVLEQSQNAKLHVHIDAAMDAVVLQGANHLQPGAVADVRKAWITMSAKIALENAAVLGAI